MVGERIQCRRNTNHSGSANDNERDQEEDTSDLFHDPATNELAHIGDTVAARVVVAKLTLDKGTPCVQSLPPEDVDSPGEGAQSIHGRGNGKHSGREDN